MIVFDKFGDGQTKQDQAVHVCPAAARRTDFRMNFEVRLGLPRPSPISNRELGLLERGLSHCKQRNAALSNRELSTVRNSTRIATPNAWQVSESPSSAPASDTNFPPQTAFLTETASQTECAVTHSKQTTVAFLTGTRNAHIRLAAQRDSAIKKTPIRVALHSAKLELSISAASTTPQHERECGSRDVSEQGKIPLHREQEKEPS